METNSKSIKDKTKLNPILDNLKSDYLLKILYDNIPKKLKFEIIKYNKKLQNKLNLSIQDYKVYFETSKQIVIEITFTKYKYGKFINIDEKDKLYYHIYFNGNKEEIKHKYKLINIKEKRVEF